MLKRTKIEKSNDERNTRGRSRTTIRMVMLKKKKRTSRSINNKSNKSNNKKLFHPSDNIQEHEDDNLPEVVGKYDTHKNNNIIKKIVK